jgi:predicted dehydrogenase
MSSVPLPVAVVGCGRMGRLHARCYAQIPGVQLIGVHDHNAAHAAAAAKDYNTAVASIEDLAERARAVTIAVPTIHHLAVARPFLERGIPCLIEKPLAPTVAEARAIAELAERHKTFVQVGHIERFNPAVVALQKLDLRPQYIETIRVSPMTFRSIDVGVVLDMMIHDIDIVLTLAGSTPAAVDSVGVAVIGQSEDICNARVRFANGCVATLSASRLALKTERKLKLVSHDGYASIDYAKKSGILIPRSPTLDALRSAAAGIRAGQVDPTTVNYSALVNPQPLVIHDVEQIRAQLDSFVAAVRRERETPIPAVAGLAAIDLAERIVANMTPGTAL